jgi:competence protein ComEC
LPGDIEPPGLNELFALQGIDADVVTAPHHGSMGSHPDEFAQWCRPDLVLVSGARSRVRPEALELYEQFGCQVVSTGTAGAIRIRLSREGVQWQSWIEHNRQSGTKRFSNFWQPVKGEFVGAQ